MGPGQIEEGIQKWPVRLREYGKLLRSWSLNEIEEVRWLKISKVVVGENSAFEIKISKDIEEERN